MKDMATLLIKNIILNGQKRDLLIDDNKIAKIDNAISGDADKVIDGKGKRVIPGFINTHSHSAMTLTRGKYEDMSLQKWLDKIWNLEAKLDEEMIYWGTKLAALEMIKSGTTAFVDQYWMIEQGVKATKEMGIRSLHSEVVLDGLDESTFEKNCAKVIEAHQKSKDWENDFTQFSITCHAAYTVTPKLFKWCADYARKNDLIFQFHLAESRKETQDSFNQHGLSPTQYIDSIGGMDCKAIAAHAVWVDDKDIDTLAKRGVTVVHNINSNLKISSGYKFKYNEFRNRGVNVALGTDGCGTSNNLDMIETMKTTAMLQKAWRENPTSMPLNELLDMASINGYNAIGVDAGKIEVGKIADIILIDTFSPVFVPNYNFEANLVYAANGSCVDTVICNGRVLMENRVVEGEREILENAQYQVDRLSKLIND